MAIINKTGITDGGTIQAEHVTRAIDALSGGSTDTVVATGSFSGSLRGTLTGTLTGTASFATSASFAPGIFTFVTGSLYTNTDGGNNLDLAITGSVSTYTLAGNKGFQRYTNAINTLGVVGELIAADTSEVQPYTVVYLDHARTKWLSVEQGGYDPDNIPLLGISLDGGKTAGTVLLNGYITAYNSGSISGSGVQLAEPTSRLGYAVWVKEGTNSGSMSTTKPTGGGAIINVGHIIASGSTVAASDNRLIRVNPRYITSI